MRKRVGIICMVFGVLLLVSAASLLFYNQEVDRKANQSVEELIPRIKLVISEQEEPEESKLLSDEMETVEIDGYEYIGYLSIPILELELPIMAEWDYSRLKIAPCLYYGSYKTDDMVLAAHNYSRHFGRLSSLEPGDQVVFTAVNGENYRYEVACIETLAPTAVEQMIESEYALSLYTCTYGGANRVTVRCRKVE